MNALPALLFSDAALHAPGRLQCPAGAAGGVSTGGAAQRQGARTTGPICPDALADNIVKLNVATWRPCLTAPFGALAKAGVVCLPKSPASSMPLDLETTAQYEGRGQVTPPSGR